MKLLDGIVYRHQRYGCTFNTPISLIKRNPIHNMYLFICLTQKIFASLQNVWHNSHQVGCAVQYCEKGLFKSGKSGYLGVCNYHPG